MKGVTVHEGCDSTWREVHATGVLNALVWQRAVSAGARHMHADIQHSTGLLSMDPVLLCCIRRGMPCCSCLRRCLPPVRCILSLPRPDACPDTCLSCAADGRGGAALRGPPGRRAAAAGALWRAPAPAPLGGCLAHAAVHVPRQLRQVGVLGCGGFSRCSDRVVCECVCRCTCSWSTTAGDGCEACSELHAGRAGKLAASVCC